MALRLIRHRLPPSDPEPAHGVDSEAAPPRTSRSNRTWIMLVLVLVVAAVTMLVVERRSGPPVSPLPVATLEGEPDIYMQSPVVSQYRSDGTLEYRLVARSAAHFQPDALTRLEQPRLTLFREHGAPWTLSARAGTLRRPPPLEAEGAPAPLAAGGADPVTEEVIFLEDDVRVEQADANDDRFRLTTPSLRLYPRRQYAETDQDVMIESSFGRTAATGLKGDLLRGLLELSAPDRARVHTVLQPEQFK